MALEHITRDIWWGHFVDSRGVRWDDDMRDKWGKRFPWHKLTTSHMHSFVIRRFGPFGFFVGAIMYVRDDEGKIVVEGNDAVVEYAGNVAAMERFLGKIPPHV